MIKKIAFTCYTVKDIARSRKFYEELLGLKCTEQFGEHWIEYDIGGTCFAIAGFEFEKYPIGSAASVAFEVSDLDAMVKRLEDAGYAQSFERMDSPVCRGAFFKDPDGNQIGLHQIK